MALFKLNRFHWQFSDDEAFRLEVGCAPELWQQTAFRGEGCAVPGVFGGGSYSRTDMEKLLAHAAEQHIQVLTEIEVPAIAALKAKHGLKSRDDVQGWMMAKLAGFLEARGIRPAA